MKYVKFIVAVLLMLLVVILIVQNHNAFSTSVVFRVDLPAIHAETTTMSVYSIVTIAFLFGFLISALYGLFERFRLKKEIRELRKTLNGKDAELSSLRNLPITSENEPQNPANGTNSGGQD